MRNWHGVLRLTNDIQKPDDTKLSFSDLAYLASELYISTPQDVVEGFKKRIALEKKCGDTYTANVSFKDIPDSFYNQLTGKKIRSYFRSLCSYSTDRLHKQSTATEI